MAPGMPAHLARHQPHKEWHLMGVDRIILVKYFGTEKCAGSLVNAIILQIFHLKTFNESDPINPSL